MRAIVTGGAGFIGSTLVQHLADAGDDVVVVDSFTDYYAPSEKRRNAAQWRGAVELVDADILDLDTDSLLGEADVVYHLAGQPGVRSSWGMEFADYTRRNIAATQKLLESARRSTRLKRFVYASSSSVYGEPAEFPVTEETSTAPFSPYGVTKLAAEHLTTLYAHNFGLPTISLRFFTVYGPRQRPDMAFRRFITSALNGEELVVFGDGHQQREFTFVADIARAVHLAGTTRSEPGTVLNLSGGSTVSVRDVLDVLAEIHGAPLRVSYGQRVDGDVRRTGARTDLARLVLGWTPTTALTDGLAAQYAWCAAAKATGELDTGRAAA